jgi:type 2 lantibiotic biosynthesis protein LanM
MQVNRLRDFIREIEKRGFVSKPEPENGVERLLLNGLLDAVEPARDRQCPGAETLPFAHLWHPVVEAAAALLPLDHITPTVSNALKLDLMARLANLGQYALWRLFEERRGSGASVVAAFAPERPGSGSADIYSSFVDVMLQERLKPLLDRFPVLERLIPSTVAFWVASSTELVKRVTQDRPTIMAKFGIPEHAVMTDLRPAMGDTHRAGRAVAVLEFSWGAVCRKLVYKPRDIRLECAFQDLLRDPRAHGPLPPLASLAIWSGDGYGYTEFVDWAPVADAADLCKFYHDAGRLGALLYMLGYSDGNHENLIARGRELYVVDTETLLTPVTAAAFRPPHASDQLGASTSLWALFDLSIARTELFPAWTFVGAAAADTSAFGIEPQAWPNDVVGWRMVNTDEMSRGRQAQAPPKALSAPVSADRENPFADHLTVFARGFRAQLTFMIAQRAVWLAEDGLLAPFKGCRGRAILRGTLVYGALAERQRTAEALTSEAAQTACLALLRRLFAGTRAPGALEQLGRSEQAQMADLDIPLFEHCASETDLVFGTELLVKSYFETSGLDACRRRIENLSQDFIATQLAILDGLVTARSLRLGRKSPTSATVPAPSVEAIGDYLLAKASDEEGGWIAFDLAPDGERFTFQPLGMSLVSGTLGVATFLAATGIDRDRAHAERLVAPLLRLAECGTAEERTRWWRDQPVGLRGSGGQLLALRMLGALGVLPERLFRAMHCLVASLPGWVLEHRPVDVWSGYSGLVGPLLLTETDAAITTAEALADRMASWVMARKHQQGKAGFAHGVAGLMAALARMAILTGKPRYFDAVNRLIEHCPDPDNASTSRGSCDWATGHAGQMIAWSSLRGSGTWADYAEGRIVAALEALERPYSTGADLYGGWPGVVVAREIASSAQGRTTTFHTALGQATPGDARHLGLFTGLCGFGLTLLGTTGARLAGKIALTAGLLPLVSLMGQPEIPDDRALRADPAPGS